MSDRIRVRFAPSPTGFLHVGGARTALFNWLFARHTGGTFILRIEDTDVARSTEESVHQIFDAMKWLGLDWDEGPGVGGAFGPYFQAQRLALYNEYAQRLLDNGWAYYSTMEAKGEEGSKSPRTAEEPKGGPSLSASGDMENAAIRFNARKFQNEIGFDDVLRGPISFKADDIEDFVILKSYRVDGLRMPTYNFGAAIDDISMEISHVLRGDDHISNTPRQVMIYQALGAPLPKFGHVPMILGPDKVRLSKRHGATSVQQFREAGIVPEALVNFLALLGWSFDDKTEIFSLEELIRSFSLERINSTPAVFDTTKLEWMNAEYLKTFSNEDRAWRITPFLREAGFLSKGVSSEETMGVSGVSKEKTAFIRRIDAAIGDRLKKLTDAVGYSKFLFQDLPVYDQKALEKNVFKGDAKAVLAEIKTLLAGQERFDEAALEPVFKDFAESRNLGLGKIFQPLRVALTGSSVSFGIFEILELLGRDRVLKRLDHVLSMEAPQ